MTTDFATMLMKQYGDQKETKEVKANGRPPSLTPEQCKDVIELVGERIKAEDEIEHLKREIKKSELRIKDLMDRKAALTNSQIARLFGVSHNVIRQIVLGEYRWTRVDAGHEEKEKQA